MCIVILTVYYEHQVPVQEDSTKYLAFRLSHLIHPSLSLRIAPPTFPPLLVQCSR